MGKVLIPFLLLSLLLAVGRPAEAAAQDPVLDSDGNPLKEGAQYRALPARSGTGGGLRMSQVDEACPPNVVQHLSQMRKGQPLMFFPEDLTVSGVIRESARTYILFPRPTRCPQSTLWQVNDEGYVTTGGSVSSDDSHRSRFAIFRSPSGKGYIIRSCPCKRCIRRKCSDVAVSNENGKNLLSVSSQNEAHEVVFARVKEAQAGTMRPEV